MYSKSACVVMNLTQLNSVFLAPPAEHFVSLMMQHATPVDEARHY
jgi:hypothetical protein